MRTSEDVKKEQDQAIFDLGFHTARIEFHSQGVDKAKKRIFELAAEGEELAKAEAIKKPKIKKKKE